MIFLRHAVTDAGPDLCYGRTDVGLGHEAEAQMTAVLSRLERPAEIRTSPLSRCRVLADRLGAAFALPPVSDARLQEYDFGDWEGRRWPDIPRSQSDPWIADMYRSAPPGGESFADLIDRVGAALQEIGDNTLVVCHAGPIRAARMILTGASFEDVFAWKVPYCEPVVLQREPA